MGPTLLFFFYLENFGQKGLPGGKAIKIWKKNLGFKRPNGAKEVFGVKPKLPKAHGFGGAKGPGEKKKTWEKKKSFPQKTLKSKVKLKKSVAPPFFPPPFKKFLNKKIRPQKKRGGWEKTKSPAKILFPPWKKLKRYKKTGNVKQGVLLGLVGKIAPNGAGGAQEKGTIFLYRRIANKNFEICEQEMLLTGLASPGVNNTRLPRVTNQPEYSCPGKCHEVHRLCWSWDLIFVNS